MGAINQAFNQAAGVVAGAALAIQHAKESDFAKMNSADINALVARNQSRAATAEANEAANEATKEGGLVDQLSEAEVNREEAEGDLAILNTKRPGGKGNTKAALEEKKKAKMSELEAAKRAERELKDKYKALMDIQDRAIEQRAAAKKSTQIAEEAKQKYQSRWGGIK